MSQIKPSSHGIVVEHKETGLHYAISDRNYDQAVHRKVRDLKEHESILSYTPKRKGDLVEADSAEATPAPKATPTDLATKATGTK